MPRPVFVHRAGLVGGESISTASTKARKVYLVKTNPKFSTREMAGAQSIPAIGKPLTVDDWPEGMGPRAVAVSDSECKASALAEQFDSANPLPRAAFGPEGAALRWFVAGINLAAFEVECLQRTVLGNDLVNVSVRAVLTGLVNDLRDRAQSAVTAGVES